MAIKEIFEHALLDAIRQKNETKKRTIRMVISNIKLAEVEKGDRLEDSAILSIIYKEIKIRRETIAEAKKGNRENVINDAESEIGILNNYLPKPMTEEEVRSMALKTIEDLKVSSPKGMGTVMKIMITEIESRAPTDQISRIVRELISNR